MDSPLTAAEYSSALGQIRVVKVPDAIHDTMVKVKLHHLGDYLRRDGTLQVTVRDLAQHIHSKTAGVLLKWFERYKSSLLDYPDEDVPKWQVSPKTWAVAPPAGVQTETVVGARLAKKEKTRRVVEAGRCYEV